MSFKFQALGLALTSGCLLTTATTITTREPLAPASKSPAIAVQAVKPESEVAKGVVNSPAPQLSSRVATPSSASTPSTSASSAPTSAPASSTSTTSSVSEVTKGEEETTPSTAVSKASAVTVASAAPMQPQANQPEQEPTSAATSSGTSENEAALASDSSASQVAGSSVSSSAASDEQAPSSNTAAVSQPSGSRSTEASVTSAATSSSPVVASSSATESSASSSGAASGSSKAGRPVNAGTVDQVLANILGKKATSSSSAPADERSGDHQALKRGGASSTNTPQRQLPQTGNQGTGLTIAGLGLFAMVSSALKRSWVSQKV